MREYKVLITPNASEQLSEIIRYVRVDLGMPLAANNLFEELTDAICGLSFMPERCKKVEIEPLSSSGVRRMNVHRYSVFYAVDDPQSIVTVIAVFFGTPADERLRRVFGEEKAVS